MNVPQISFLYPPQEDRHASPPEWMLLCLETKHAASLPCDALFGLSSGNGTHSGAGGPSTGAELALPVPGSPFRSRLPRTPRCPAPHTSSALSEAPARLYLPALKRAEKRVRE